MIDFTLAIVNWNTRDLLEKCIRSIKQHSEGYTIQILVLDNASEDGSADMVEQTFPDAILVKNKRNVGFARGHEKLLPYSKGCYHVLVNSDIEVKEGCFTAIFNRMKNDRIIGVLGPQISGPDGHIQPSCRKLPTLPYLFWDAMGIGKLLGGWFNPYHMAAFDHKTSRPVDQVMGSFFVIRTSIIPLVGFLDTRFFMYFEEVDYCKRVLNKGFSVFFEAGARVYHQGGGSSQKVKVQTIRRTMRSMHQYFKKHSGFWVTAPLLVIAALDTVTHFLYALIHFKAPFKTLKAYTLGLWDILTLKRAD